MKKQLAVMTQHTAVTEVTVIDSHFDNFRDYIDIIQVYQCRICGYHSPLRHAIASHMSEVHFPKTCYLCQLCQFVYEDKAQLRHHITTTHAAECSDEATINAPSIILPPGFVPNGIPYAQLRHYGDATAPVVLAGHDNRLSAGERSNIPCEGFPVNSFAASDADCSSRVNKSHAHQSMFHPAEREYISHSASSVVENSAISVKKEPPPTKVRPAECENGESNAAIRRHDNQNDTDSSDKNSRNQLSGSGSNCSDSKAAEMNNRMLLVNGEQEKPIKKGKSKVRGKPSLSAVLTNLAAQHTQAEVGNGHSDGKRESPAHDSSSSEGDADNARKEDAERKSVQSNSGYSSAQTSNGNHFMAGQYLTYKRAHSVGLPPKKIKLEIIENGSMGTEEKTGGSRHDGPRQDGPRHDGPYNADGSFDYYSLTGWKAYQCDLCNKGKRGRRVSFKTAQELAEHSYFVHGKPVPLPMPTTGNVPVGMYGDTPSGIQPDGPVPFDVYHTPIPWPPPPTLHSHEESHRRVGQRPMPVLDLSVPVSLSSTEGGSDVNGEENNISDERNNHGPGHEDDEDTHSDDSRSTVPANDAMRFMAYSSDNSDRNDQMDFPADYHPQSLDSAYMGHKVRKTFSSRLAALQRGEISRKKDPKFDEAVIKSSYNADGSFDYFSLTGWKAYKCELCKKRRFKTATELAEHKRAMHPGMEINGESAVILEEKTSTGDVDKPQTSEAEGAG